MILANAPEHLVAKPFCKTGFVINPSPIICEISYKELCLPNRSDNFIVNPVVVLLAINSEGFVSGCPYTRFHRLSKKLVKLGGERHSDERFCAFGLRTS